MMRTKVPLGTRTYPMVLIVSSPWTKPKYFRLLHGVAHFLQNRRLPRICSSDNEDSKLEIWNLGVILLWVYSMKVLWEGRRVKVLILHVCEAELVLCVCHTNIVQTSADWLEGDFCSTPKLDVVKNFTNWLHLIVTLNPAEWQASDSQDSPVESQGSLGFSIPRDILLFLAIKFRGRFLMCPVLSLSPSVWHSWASRTCPSLSNVWDASSLSYTPSSSSPTASMHITTLFQYFM